MTTLFAPFRDVDFTTRGRPTPVVASAAVPFDAVRTDAAVELSFDLPGHATEDVQLSVDRNVLTLTAERSRSVDPEAKLVVGERRHGKVRRQLRLSESLDLGAIEARFDNGVLHVRIPVAESAQPHQVEIVAGAAPMVDAPALEADSGEGASAN